MAQFSVPSSLLQSALNTQEQLMEKPSRQGDLFIGLPKEEMFQENRIALTPRAVQILASQGHRILLETGAGDKSQFTDHEYSEAGAEIVFTREAVFKANIILKAAPPSLEEIELCQPNQILISPIHLPTLTEEYLYRLKTKRVIAMAMEYIKDTAGAFPFVRIMSELAGISAMQTAAELLSLAGGGRGVLLGGISGVPPAKVVILGAGVVAEYAARAALGFGAEVRVFDDNVRKLMRLQHNLGTRLFTSVFDPIVLQQELHNADVAIGAIHSPTGRTPMIVSEQMVESMKRGAVVIDVSIDQGGCFATSRLTTSDKPTFRAYDVIHYCVPNIASRVPRTGSTAFSNIITPLIQRASETGGFERLIQDSPGLQNGVYIYKNCLTNEYMSRRFGMKHTDINLLLSTSNF